MEETQTPNPNPNPNPAMISDAMEANSMPKLRETLKEIISEETFMSCSYDAFSDLTCAFKTCWTISPTFRQWFNYEKKRSENSGVREMLYRLKKDAVFFKYFWDEYRE